MKYSPSPRPTFDRATVIPYASVTKHLWGDKESGEVADWIYVSSSKVHCLVFGLPPQGWFRHSDSFRTIFGADVTYLVLSGVMVIANPETGEVHRALTGDVAFFRRDTWHHVYSYSAEPLRVLEFFAPPPSSGTSGAYAKEKSLLVNNKYTRDEWLGQLPMIFFDPYLLHYSDLNRSKSSRRAIIYTYNPARLGKINERRLSSHK